MLMARWFYKQNGPPSEAGASWEPEIIRQVGRALQFPLSQAHVPWALFNCIRSWKNIKTWPPLRTVPGSPIIS